MASALGAIGVDPSLGRCACLRQELAGNPDGKSISPGSTRGGPAALRASPSLLLYHRAGSVRVAQKTIDTARLLMDSGEAFLSDELGS